MTLEPKRSSVLLLLAMAAAGRWPHRRGAGAGAARDLDVRAGQRDRRVATALWQTSLRLAQLRQEARDKSDAEGLARLFLRTQKAGAMAWLRCGCFDLGAS